MAYPKCETKKRESVSSSDQNRFKMDLCIILYFLESVILCLDQIYAHDE